MWRRVIAVSANSTMRVRPILTPGEAAASSPKAKASSIRLLYSFSGEASIGDITIDAGESVFLDSGDAAVVARSDADLVLFMTDLQRQSSTGACSAAMS